MPEIGHIRNSNRERPKQWKRKSSNRVAIPEPLREKIINTVASDAGASGMDAKRIKARVEFAREHPGVAMGIPALGLYTLGDVLRHPNCPGCFIQIIRDKVAALGG